MYFSIYRFITNKSNHNKHHRRILIHEYFTCQGNILRVMFDEGHRVILRIFLDDHRESSDLTGELTEESDQFRFPDHCRFW
jgi:hypothetical protein